MAEQPADDKPVYDATVGDPFRLTKAASDEDPQTSKIRVLFGGELASKAFSSELAAELSALIEREGTPSAANAPQSPTDTLKISLRGLVPAREADDALVQRIREHIEARLSCERDPGVDSQAPRSAQ